MHTNKTEIQTQNIGILSGVYTFQFSSQQYLIHNRGESREKNTGR